MSPLSRAQIQRNYRDRQRFARDAAADPVGSIVRGAIALSRNRFDELTTPTEFARRAWADDRGVELVLRAASSPAMTTAPGWAQELSHVAIEFIASLVPQSAGADLLGRGFQLKFNGAGSISLPTISQGQASFIGQAKAIPVAQFTTASGLAIVPHKLAMISVVTREMLESSNAEAIVGAVLIESAARGLDNALFSSGAGTADQPAGLLFGIAPTAASTSTILTDAMLVDLSTRGGAVARVAGSNIVYICAPEQAIAISVSAPNFACPVLASAALPPKTVVAVAAAAIASAYDPAPMIEASREAELVMDSAAGDLMTGGATSSLNHTDRIALRMKLPVAWALRSSSALAWIQSAVW